MASDFVLAVSRAELTDTLEIVSIKREMYNVMPWLSDYCKDRNLLKREYLEVNTLRLIEYFTTVLREEGYDIHDFAGCKLQHVNQYDICLRFLAYRNE